MPKHSIPRVNWTVATDLVELVKADAEADFMKPTQKVNQILREYYRAKQKGLI